MRNELAEIESCCRAVIAETASLLTWEWDDYIGAFLASFGSNDASRIHSICDKYFMSRWDTDSIAKMPAAISAVAESLGGLRFGQNLFATRPAEFVMAYGAWWPWGDGETISLRIGMITTNVPAHAGDELFKEFSEWFTSPEAVKNLSGSQ